MVDTTFRSRTVIVFAPRLFAAITVRTATPGVGSLFSVCTTRRVGVRDDEVGPFSS